MADRRNDIGHSNMRKEYFLADTNSLVHAYRAGGPELLDAHLHAANDQDRKFAITHLHTQIPPRSLTHQTKQQHPMPRTPQ